MPATKFTNAHSTPAAVVGGFRPRALSEAEWAVAGDAVRAAVAGCVGAGDRDEQNLIASVARMLAWAQWDRTTAPDLNVLLTRDAVDRFAASTTGRTRRALRHQLRRVADHVAGGDPSGVRTPRPQVVFSQSGAAFMAAAAGLGPFIALDAARRQGHGRGLHGQMLNGAPDVRCSAPDLALLSGAAADGDAGTFAAASRSAQLLADVTGVLPKEVVPINVSPSVPTPTNRPAQVRAPKAPSRAAVRRARAARAAGSPVAPSAGPLPLAADVEAALVAWRPKGLDKTVWAACADATRELVRGYRPKATGSTLRNPASILTRYAAWVLATRGADRSGPVTAAEVTADGAADAYLAYLASAGRPVPTQATVRSTLRRALAGVGGRPRPTALSYQPAPAPLSPRQCADLVRLCRNQPTAAKRRALSARVALGLGAGLDAGDQRGVTPAHIARVPAGGRTVTVVDVVGDRPRRVVVADAFADLLWEAVELHQASGRGVNTPLHGVKVTRRCVASPVADSAVTATGAPVELKLSALRSTWLLAAMCSPVPLADLMRAAGLRSARPFTDLLPFAPDPEPGQVAAVLAGLSVSGVR